MMPSVTCVCLTADRQVMTDRAVKCFLNQTYPDRHLLIYDTGNVRYELPADFEARRITLVHEIRPPYATIGMLRNIAVGLAQADIIAHWDSDDWSHPLRLAWQVQRLREPAHGDTGTPQKAPSLVGYRSMMFWRGGEAWRYQNELQTYVIGTSMCYWRKAWEAKSFPERGAAGAPLKFGEDNEWQKGIARATDEGFFKSEPAMIAEMHGGNITDHADIMIKSPNWQRVAEWDAKVERLMRI